MGTYFLYHFKDIFLTEGPGEPVLHMVVDCKFAGEGAEVYLPHLHLRQQVLVSLVA